MSVFVLILGLFFVFLIVKKTGVVFNPVVCLFIYFYFLLLFSQFSITGVPKPSELTTIYFLVAFSCAAIGVLLSRPRGPVLDKNIVCSNEPIIYYVVVFFAIVPLFFAATENVKYILSNGYESYVFRSRFLGDKVTITGSVFLTSVIERISRPVALSAVIIGVVFFFKGISKRVFFSGALSMILFSFIFVKRIDLMFLVVIFLSAYLAFKVYKFGIFSFSTRKNSLILYSMMFSFFCLIIFISSHRATGYGFLELMYHYAVGYHTFGFALFDYALNNPASGLHDIVFPGSSIFGAFTFLYSQFLKIFDIQFMSTASELYASELSEYIFMGYNTFDGAEIAPNAFYTSLYPIYRDLKLFGIVVVPFIYGLFLGKAYMTFRDYRQLSSAIWLGFFVWVGYASLLTPVLMSNTFWFIPILIWFFTSFRVVRF